GEEGEGGEESFVLGEPDVGREAGPEPGEPPQQLFPGCACAGPGGKEEEAWPGWRGQDTHLKGELVGRAVEELPVSPEDGPRVTHREHYKAGDDALDRMQAVLELGDHSEVAASPPERPEEIGMGLRIGHDPTAVCE